MQNSNQRRPVGSLPPSKLLTGPASPRCSVCALGMAAVFLYLQVAEIAITSSHFSFPTRSCPDVFAAGGCFPETKITQTKTRPNAPTHLAKFHLRVNRSNVFMVNAWCS